MGLVPDQGAVQELAAASPIQRSAIAFMRGVATLQSTIRIPASARTASNAAVKFDPRSRIMNLDPISLSAEVHQEVACPLGGPFPGWMQGDSEDADAPGGVLDHGQDVGLVPLSRSTVNKSHARIAWAWERRNCDQVGPDRCGAGSIPAFFRISHAVDAATFTPRPASSPWILR